MADTSYKPLPYLYKSIGLHAREAYDRCPEYSYIFLMNGLERDEESLSSRYGYLIVNRDPDGTPSGQNYFFNYPVTSIAKMYFQGNPQRYVGLADGSLWQRNSNSQGQFSQIYEGLSGNPFDTLIASCYETALPFFFIYDEAGSIKVAAGSSTPQLTGIDPPPYTANALPFSPLLSLIDNFAQGNSYVVSGFDGGGPWAYAFITNIEPIVGSMVTDFPQFVSQAYTIAGGTTSAISSSSSPNETASNVYSGFPSAPVAPGEVVTLTIVGIGSVSETGDGSGGVSIALQYSIDSGVSWTTIFSSGPQLLPPSITVSITGLSNINTLQIKAIATSTYTGGTVGTLTSTIAVSSIGAAVSIAGIFGTICNGILSVLNGDAVTSIPIVSIAASGLVGDIYTSLTIVTGKPHGAATGQPISIYGASNDLADGFYNATVVDSITLTVPFLSPAGFPVGIDATGGTLQYVSASNVGPNTCVLTQEYSTPYPTQFAAWGFYQQVPLTASNFPVGCWSGLVDASSTATVGVTADFDLSQHNQVTDSDLIVLTLQVGSPENITNIRLQFDVNNSGYTSSYYYANISPAYYQGNIANSIAAYQTTQNQILADALGLLTGQPESSTTAQLQPSNFSTGESAWVAVLIPRGNFLPVGSAGQSGLDWTNITGWQVIIETATTGNSTVSLNGLYLQWGYGPSSFAGVGYDYRLTFYNANTGTESSPNPEMEFNQQYGYLSSLAAPFYLRQAAQVSGYYSFDSQVTHYRVYRRGGIYANNWLLIDQIPNITAGGQFQYKDVVPDASLAQAQPLVLDNDPPVTSSLVTPILTTLSAATTGPGSSIYSIYAPQLITVEDDAAVFVPNQTVLLGNAYNLEEVMVITGGTGQFTAIVRLQHNAGEQVQVNSTPRTFCNLCCAVNLPGGATQVLVAGDKSNPHRVYYAKPGQPENFGPENYVDSSSPDDPVMALINWRGTGLVATQNTWYIFVGGAQPYLQPTGAAHGMIAEQGWCLVEGEVAFRAADGWRFFSGADGKYMTLPVEWIFRTNPDCLPPQASASDASLDVFAYYNNLVIGSYLSLNDGIRYRLIYDTQYNRYRQDDIAATAMLWERDTNLLLCGVPIQSASNTIGYALVEDQQYNQDYDDGGWSNTSSSPDLTLLSTTWNNVQNATSVFSANYASAQLAVINQIEAIVAPLFIPPDATVTGIAVSFNAWGYILNTTPVSAAVYLGGTLSARQSTPNITGSPAPYTLGSSSFQWGFALTPALLNEGLIVYVYGGFEAFGIGGTKLNGLVVTVFYKLSGSDELLQLPINITIQLPYKDVGKPHFPKQFNVLETDANTQGQDLETTLLFNTEPPTSIVLPAVNSGTVRQKLQQEINDGDGQQAYAMSIKHTMAVTVAPTLFQENIYAAILADYRTSFDSYWQKAGINELKLWKEGYFDYSATEDVTFSLYANGYMDHPYFQFTLPAQADRSDVRVLFPALKCRLWRMVGVSAGDFQLWSPVTIDSKPLLEGSGYERVPYGVYE